MLILDYYLGLGQLFSLYSPNSPSKRWHCPEGLDPTIFINNKKVNRHVNSPIEVEWAGQKKN